MKKVLLFLLSVYIFGNISAQKAEKQKLTIEQIINENPFPIKRINEVHWLKDGNGYSTLENNDESKGNEIVRYDAQTGERKILISTKQLTPAGEQKPLAIAAYSWSDDNSKLLIFTNTKRVWRYHTKGDYWLLDLQSGKLQQLGKTLEKSSLMFAKFSPDAAKVAYVSNQNIYVEELSTGTINQITLDGGKNIINGTFDWVYEEEFDCRDGFRWSSDGRFIAYWQSDTQGTGVFYLIDNIDSIYSKVIPLPYPKVGTTNSAVKVGVIPSSGGKTKWFDIPGDNRNNYIPRMDFIPGSNELLIQQLNRLQNTNTVWVGNAQTIGLSNILTEKDDAWVDIHDNIEWVEQSKYFTWTSERDGWNHLYKISRDGRNLDLITKGDFDVISVECIDENGGYVYYIASPENYTQRYLYRSRLDGTGTAEKVSPGNMKGQHHYQISPNALWAIHTFENHITPPVISLVSLPDHKQIRKYEENLDAKDKFKSLNLIPKKFFKIDIGDIILDAWMIVPPDFDPGKKYPVIFYVYGEPAASTVQDNWNGGDLWHQYLAQNGYIVISVDNRGTNVPRGRLWRKSIYKQIGILASRDQAEAAKAIGREFPFVDNTRMGIWGWSGGGSMTLNCMFRYPEIYHTGIAVAFISDQKLYDAVYQERYMGLPTDNPIGYRDGSPITYAANLQGNLMLIHGTGDDNVHYQNCEMLVNELVKQGKMFSMLAYPMRTHGIFERENTSLHLRKTMDKFWKEHLEKGAK